MRLKKAKGRKRLKRSWKRLRITKSLELIRLKQLCPKMYPCTKDYWANQPLFGQERKRDLCFAASHFYFVVGQQKLAVIHLTNLQISFFKNLNRRLLKRHICLLFWQKRTLDENEMICLSLDLKHLFYKVPNSNGRNSIICNCIAVIAKLVADKLFLSSFEAQPSTTFQMKPSNDQ